MKLRDIVEKRSPQSIDETHMGGVIGCPDFYPDLFRAVEVPVNRTNCDADCRACWNQNYCPAEDCVSCDNVNCILHPGDGDD